jgi:hypothetical protein
MQNEESQIENGSESEVTAQDAEEVSADATPIPVMSYEDGKRFDSERESNTTGWEATAQELNSRRSLGQKILGRGEETPEGVMHDEALRVNAEISRQLKSNQKENEWEEDHVRRNGEPLREEMMRPTTRQGVFEQLKADETEYMSQKYFHKEPFFNPKAEHANTSADEIAKRERGTRKTSDKVNEALAAGDINGAEKALAENADGWKLYDDITMSEHITPALRKVVGNILLNDRMSLTELVEARYLSAYIYPNMAIDAGVSPERLRQDDLRSGVTRLAGDAIKRYGPHMFETDKAGNRPALEELTRRLDVLSRLGVMSREEIANDSHVRRKAEELAIDTTAGKIATYTRDGFSLSIEAWQLVRLGLLDLHQLAESPAMVRVATMQTAAESKKIINQARRELRKALLGDEEPPQDSQQAA